MRATPADRPPRPLIVASFVSSLDRFGLAPLLVLIAHELDAPLAAVVGVASGYFMAYGLSQPLWGWLSDRFGRLPVIRGALVAAAVAGVASAMAPGLGWLVVTRALAGAFMGAVVPNTLAFVGDTSQGHGRQRALTDVAGSIALGTALATAAAGLAGDTVGWRVVFLVPAAAALGCAVWLRTVAESPRPPMTTARTVLGGLVARPWLLVVLALAFTEGGLLLGPLTFLAPALQSQGLQAAWAGMATATYGIGTLVATQVVRRIVHRVSIERLMAAGGAVMCLGNLLTALQVSLVGVLVTALLFGAGWSALHTSLQNWATSVYPQARGIVLALFASALFLGSATTTWISGAWAQQARWPLIFGLAAAAAVPMTVVAVVGHRRFVRE